MARIFFQILLPIALPTILYLLWVAAERRRQERLGSGEAPQWQDAPWLWLGALGVFLAAIMAAALALLGGATTEGRYVPPQVIDGKIVPGHVEPKRTK